MLTLLILVIERWNLTCLANLTCVTTLLQCWVNVVAMLLPNIVTMLICRHFTMFQQCCVWILSQRCVNVVPKLYQRCAKVVPTLYECCTNIVLTLVPDVEIWSNYNVGTMLCECCDNVIPQCWGLTLREHSGDVVWMLWQCCSRMFGV